MLNESLKSYQPLFDSVAKKAAEDGFNESELDLFQELFKEN